jgi:hypothetical protein
MFGCTTAQIREEFNDAKNKKIYLMGILSDAQEITAFSIEYKQSGLHDQLLNKAKYIIDQLLETK